MYASFGGTHLYFQIHATVRRAYLDGKAKSVAFRKQQLAQLGCLITENEERIHQALTADLGRHRLENDLYVFPSHIAPVVMETP